MSLRKIKEKLLKWHRYWDKIPFDSKATDAGIRAHNRFALAHNRKVNRQVLSELQESKKEGSSMV